MLTNIFEARNKTFLNLVKLGDYLGRSLRENVELFQVDGWVVTYLTESGDVIRGEYSKDALKLSNVDVESVDILENEELFSKLTDKKVSGFLADLLESDIPQAKNSFDSILGLWETKLNFNRIQKRLVNKIEKFDESLNILGTTEFERILELKDDLVTLLKEHEEFLKIPDIRNIIKLSAVISNAFNIPYIQIEDLKEDKEFEVPPALNTNLYEHLCRQELLGQELLESRNHLDSVWISNERIQRLPSMIYESDDNIMQLVAEIVSEIPYFAMATKKQLTALVAGNLDLLVEDKQIPEKDIKSFVAKIFEFKRPVKEFFTDVLNEKYGINVHTLTTVPTFNSLIGMETLIFESFSKLSPKNSNLRRVLYEFSELLKEKSGVESIDVSDFLNGLFSECGYDSILTETSLMNYLNFDRIADDLGKVGQVLKMIQAGQMGGDPGAQLGAEMGQPMDSGQDQIGDGGPLSTGMSMDDVETEEPGELDQDSDDNPMAKMNPDQAAAEAGMENEIPPGQEEGIPGQDGEEGEMGGSGDPIMDTIEQIKSLISDLELEMGGGEEEGMPDEGMEGELPPEEGMEGSEGTDIDSESVDDEIPLDTKSHNGEESEEEEDSMPPPKKKKKKE